jgi:hypothetical protein
LSLLVKNRTAFFIYSTSSILFFSIIFCSVAINLPGYIHFGYLLIKGFDEAMYIKIEPGRFPFLWALSLMLLFLATIVIFIVQSYNARSLHFKKIIYSCVLCMACFLFYKNGFTRADNSHWVEFFSIFPFFIVSVLILSGFGNTYTSKAVAIAFLVISFYGSLYTSNDSAFIGMSSENLSTFLGRFSPIDYLSGAYKEYEESIDLNTLFPEYTRNLIGSSRADMVPLDVQMLYYNNINYLPRPVPQSYVAYDTTLDNINAMHFSRVRRPEVVLIKTYAIDNRYAFWDESVTKAALHLNYDYWDFLGAKRDGSLSTRSYLLLKAKKDSHLLPRFEEISTLYVKMGQVVKLNFPATEPIYMKADIQYTALGKIRRLFYQPPELNITLYFDGPMKQYQFRALRQIFQGPVLINKTVMNSIEIKKFYTRNLKENVNVIAFSFDPGDAGFEQSVKLTFLKFSNY